MLTVLLESRAARERRVGGTVLSMLVHGSVIAAIVALTIPDRGSARPGPEVIHTVRFAPRTPPKPNDAVRHPNASAPKNPAPARPDLPTIDVPTITSTTIPPIDLSVPATTSDDILIGRRSDLLHSGTGAQGGLVSDVAGVSDESAVDRAPRILGRAPEPRYPATLRAAGVQGRVLAEFVVDTLGRAEISTLRFTELANPLFGDAVREVLGRYHFSPGEVAGRKVRTRVAVPFEFRLEGQQGR